MFVASGHDGYPLGFDCANPYTWPDNALPTYYRTLHLQQSPSTPYSIVEFQGGSFDPWGGLGFAQCGELLNAEFERVFYKVLSFLALHSKKPLADCSAMCPIE